jgi:hypothetical protein
MGFYSQVTGEKIKIFCTECGDYEVFDMDTLLLVGERALFSPWKTCKKPVGLPRRLLWMRDFICVSNAMGMGVVLAQHQGINPVTCYMPALVWVPG